MRDFKNRLKRSRERMYRFRGLSDSFSLQCLREAEAEYSMILAHQEDFWKQRAKQFWLQGG